MTIPYHHQRGYICDFCSNLIENENQGVVIFGSVCTLGVRGIKAIIGEVPTECNYVKLEKQQTCICSNCLRKKILCLSEIDNQEGDPKSNQLVKELLSLLEKNKK